MTQLMTALTNEQTAGEALLLARNIRWQAEAAHREDRDTERRPLLRACRRNHGSARTAWQRARNERRRAEARFLA